LWTWLFAQGVELAAVVVELPLLGAFFMLWGEFRLVGSSYHCWDSSSIVWEASHFSRDEIYFGGSSSCVVVHKKENWDSFYHP
jgi:hypothetical protein